MQKRTLEPGIAKRHGLEESLGAAAVELTGKDLARVEQARASIDAMIDRYPGSHQGVVDR